MLFIESRTAETFVGHAARVALLEGLQERGLVPVIRSSRLRCFEQALGGGGERARELEQSIAAQSEAEGELPYVRGDVFCFEGFAHFLVFGDAADEGPPLRAGIVYEADMRDAARDELDKFCRNVKDVLEANESHAPVEWKTRADARPNASRFAFDAARANDSAERARAVEIIKDAEARNFLRRLAEAHADAGDGQPASPSSATSAPKHDPARGELIARLVAANLARRGVLVSCRKSGRPLFRLPSPDALAIVTASDAVCSECGAAVADEHAEEMITPTPLAHAMLGDGAWLATGMRAALAQAGVPAAEIRTRADSDHGDTQLLAPVSGEPFLFVLRDGDFTGTDARRALEAEAESGAAHLAVVATGKLHDEARARLREHARRRSRTGGEFELILAEGVEAAAAELTHAAERISRRALARELYELDASAGFNVGHMLAARFRLAHRHGSPRDLAASAVGALREI